MNYFCFADTQKAEILNKQGAEIVKSVYINSLNSSILLISIEVNFNVVGQMKCR